MRLDHEFYLLFLQEKGHEYKYELEKEVDEDTMERIKKLKETYGKRGGNILSIFEMIHYRVEP